MNELQKAFNADNFRKNGHQLIDTLADYFDDVSQAKMPVMKWRPPNQSS